LDTTNNHVKLQAAYATMPTNYPICLNPDGGNVGIGTTNPQARLDVTGGFRVQGGNFGEFSIENDNSKFNYSGFSPNKGLKILHGAAVANDGRTTFLNNGQSQNGNNGFDFYMCGHQTDPPILATIGCGKIGIGKRIPSASTALDVSGNATISGTLTVNNIISNSSGDSNINGNINVSGAIRPSNGTGFNGIMFQDNPGPGTGDTAYIKYYARSGEHCTLEIGISNDYPHDHILLNPSGFVGIKQANPQYELHVEGNVAGWSFSATSDYRIKENIEILNDSYNVDNLKPVSYLNKKQNKQDIGLIAHEVQEVFPCLVTGEKDGEHMQSVNYTGLIPILIKEIQELKKEIKMLKEKIV